jgi:enoyl-CoA hydratase
MEPPIPAAEPEPTAVRVARDGGTLRITLSRPAKLNALRPADIHALRAAMDLPAGVRAVVFAGAGGRAFCAGMHVDTFAELTPESARAFIAELRDMLAAVRTAPVPTVCAVDGYCLGVGFELALACDLRVATTRSAFGLPEIKVGIPSVADAALLSEYVGLSLAKEMILTGDVYPVGRFSASGLCNTVVPPDRLAAAVARRPHQTPPRHRNWKGVPPGHSVTRGATGSGRDAAGLGVVRAQHRLQARHQLDRATGLTGAAGADRTETEPPAAQKRERDITAPAP